MGIKNLFIGRKLLQPFFRKLHSISLRGMNYGIGAYVDQSGEEWVLKQISKLYKNEKPIIFDVGANHGDYTFAVIKHIPQAMVYSFEPSLPTFNLLTSSLKNFNVNTVQVGFSNEKKTTKLYFDNQTSGLASVYPINYDHLKGTILNQEEIQLIKLDDFCLEQKISLIHLLKIDVEGHEFEVLEGAKNLIESNSIHMIQFEFGIAMMESKRFLKDFKELLSQYVIYRILQDGIEPLIFDEKVEIFLTTNYLAIHKNLKGL